MDSKIEIKLKYYGYFSELLNTSEETIVVDVELKKAIDSIKLRLIDKKVNIPYVLLLNSQNMYMLSKCSKFVALQHGDIIKVIPILAGG